jgi:hypothetical protein
MVVTSIAWIGIRRRCKEVSGADLLLSRRVRWIISARLRPTTIVRLGPNTAEATSKTNGVGW